MILSKCVPEGVNSRSDGSEVLPTYGNNVLSCFCRTISRISRHKTGHTSAGNVLLATNFHLSCTTL